MELHTRVCIAGLVYLVGHYFTWKSIHDNMKMEMSDAMKDRLVKKDLDRVAKFGGKHCHEVKSRRKLIENYLLSKEIKKRQTSTETSPTSLALVYTTAN